MATRPSQGYTRPTFQSILHTLFTSKVLRTLFIAVFVFLYCEIFHYAVVLIQCTWPQAPTPPPGKPNAGDVKAMFIADTHLLGFKEGHWFDRIRREWQMKQAFQTSMVIHKPDVVFVLGDLLDEGKWCPDEEFQYHVSRFRSMFQVPEGTELYVVSGNHDEGFHYMMTPHKHERFVEEFHSPSVRLLRVKGIPFVLVNSMAMEGDGCQMCAKAEKELQKISRSLRFHEKCDKMDQDRHEKCHAFEGLDYVQPILLQHFPMYRLSDDICDTEDAASPSEKVIPFRVRYDCLDQRSTDLLFTKVKPRLVISAHTHHGCYLVHSNNVPEWSVSSFSWRNRNNPTSLLVRINSFNFTTKQCFLPEEATVVRMYMVGGALLVLNLLWPFKCLSRRKKVY